MTQGIRKKLDRWQSYCAVADRPHNLAGKKGEVSIAFNIKPNYASTAKKTFSRIRLSYAAPSVESHLLARHSEATITIARTR